MGAILSVCPLSSRFRWITPGRVPMKAPSVLRAHMTLFYGFSFPFSSPETPLTSSSSSSPGYAMLTNFEMLHRIPLPGPFLFFDPLIILPTSNVSFSCYFCLHLTSSTKRKWRYRALNWWSSFRVIFSLALQLRPFQHKRHRVLIILLFQRRWISSPLLPQLVWLLCNYTGFTWVRLQMCLPTHSWPFWIFVSRWPPLHGIPGGELLSLQSTRERIILFVGKNSQGLSSASDTHTAYSELEALWCVCSVFVLLQVARKGHHWEDCWESWLELRRVSGPAPEALCGVLRSSD